VRFLRSFFSLLVVILVEVISQFLFVVVGLVADTKFEFALLGAEDDRLAVHAPNHVERRLRFAAQGQLQQVLLDAAFDGLAQLRLDLKEAIGRTQAFNALVGALMVVMLDPEFDPFPGRLEGIELGAHQKVLPDGRPEAFDLAQRHRMLRPRLEVRDPILLQLGFETAGAPPGGVLAAVVGEHLLGRLKLARRHAIDFDHRRRRGTAEQIRPHNEARVIIHEGDEVGILSAQPEGEDVRLPHLIGRGPLEEAGANHVPALGRLAFSHQTGLMQALPNRLRTGWQEETTAQHLADAFDAEGRILLLEFDDLVGDRSREPGRASAGIRVLQARLAVLPISPEP